MCRVTDQWICPWKVAGPASPYVQTLSPTHFCPLQTVVTKSSAPGNMELARQFANSIENGHLTRMRPTHVALPSTIRYPARQKPLALSFAFSPSLEKKRNNYASIFTNYQPRHSDPQARKSKNPRTWMDIWEETSLEERCVGCCGNAIFSRKKSFILNLDMDFNNAGCGGIAGQMASNARICASNGHNELRKCFVFIFKHNDCNHGIRSQSLVRSVTFCVTCGVCTTLIVAVPLVPSLRQGYTETVAVAHHRTTGRIHPSSPNHPTVRWPSRARPLCPMTHVHWSK